ncbi:VWA domain-containing protein [Anabaena sp. CCY 9910]|uniref:VWA domain-containing protein n=1 Tax=Anabaena sp. CCY 9910 TaxID=3103870 RepID=UPI0039DFA17B
MKLEELPLLDIFNSLRQRHGLPLGVEEYLVVVHSFRAGVGVNSRQELEQLCCMLWAKSEEENRLIQRLFGEMWKQIELHPVNSPESLNEPTSSKDTSILISESFTPENDESNSIETATSKEFPLDDEVISNLEATPTITPEPVQAVQAVRSIRRDRERKRPRYLLLTEYFPVTKRQMKQCWRYLRRPVRQGLPTELDVEATVAKIGHEGILLQPVMMPPRKNRTDLVLLIDQEGSMVPFHDLSRQLVETAQRGGRLRTTNVFYFHDYPDEYLYRHPAMLEAKAISEVLAEIGERAAVLIISDAGAARGNFDAERVNNTKVWIEQLQQSVRYFAWLNPIPSECWRQTTAEEIARFVPMFEMSPQGMNAAISVLRGRYIAGEVMYSWLM